MSLIHAQEKYIEQVNACVRPKDRRNRVRRAANKKLTKYLMSIGVTTGTRQICNDAWDMAELERNAE